MYIFKTSGETFTGVIENQKHAFKNSPRAWHKGEIILVSKNKANCAPGEKQIQYIMKLEKIRKTTDKEIEKYWPGNPPGRWRYIIDCYGIVGLENPFNLEDILGMEKAAKYKPVITFKKMDPSEEESILKYLKLKT